MSDFKINGEVVPPVEEGAAPTLAQSVAEMFAAFGVESITFEDPE
jgi:hypothetical protein